MSCDYLYCRACGEEIEENVAVRVKEDADEIWYHYHCYEVELRKSSIKGTDLNF